jgi:hypothetical protein
MVIEVNFKTSMVHNSLVHLYLKRKKFIFIKKLREPNFCEPKLGELNLCEPSSHIFSVHSDLWFTFFHSSQILRGTSEPWFTNYRSDQKAILFCKIISYRYFCFILNRKLLLINIFAKNLKFLKAFFPKSK